MKRAPRVPIIAITLLAGLAFSNPLGLCAASNYAIVSQSGQGLSSVFEGLKPNAFAQPEGLSRYQPRSGSWKGIISHRLPGLAPASIIEGGSCPGGSVCSGHYTSFAPSTDNCGGSGSGCSVYDFFTDPGASCAVGEQSFYCETTLGTCCLDAIACSNPRGC